MIETGQVYVSVEAERRGFERTVEVVSVGSVHVNVISHRPGTGARRRIMIKRKRLESFRFRLKVPSPKESVGV